MRRSVSPISGSPVLPGGSRADPCLDDRAARSHPSAAAAKSSAVAAKADAARRSGGGGGAPLASMGVAVRGLASVGWGVSGWISGGSACGCREVRLSE
jgi:hypothetical protein